MTKKTALEILERHNDWRMGKEIPMLTPELIGQAIHKATEALQSSIVTEQTPPAKKILIEELQENAHPEPVEDVIFWALEAYDKSRVEHGNTWGRVCAGAIVSKIKEAEAKARKVTKSS